MYEEGGRMSFLQEFDQGIGYVQIECFVSLAQTIDATDRTLEALGFPMTAKKQSTGTHTADGDGRIASCQLILIRVDTSGGSFLPMQMKIFPRQRAFRKTIPESMRKMSAMGIGATLPRFMGSWRCGGHTFRLCSWWGIDRSGTGSIFLGPQRFLSGQSNAYGKASKRTRGGATTHCENLLGVYGLINTIQDQDCFRMQSEDFYKISGHTQLRFLGSWESKEPSIYCWKDENFSMERVLSLWYDLGDFWVGRWWRARGYSKDYGKT